MRALSFSRPWTELIVAGLKGIENRSWPTPYRGPLVVHAAKSWDPSAIEVLDDLAGYGMLTDDDYALLDTCTMGREAPTGYIGVVTVTDCHHAGSLACRSDEDPDRCSPWAFDGSWHWAVTDARRFPEPIPGAGRLGLWTPPDDVLCAATRACTTTAVGGSA